MTTEPETLTRFLTDQLPVGSIGAVRQIRQGDEAFLQPTELAGLERAVVAVRRASGSGRAIARQLCQRLGTPVAAIPRSVRAPVWPDGIVGSIAHDRSFAAAAVGHANAISGLGIDIEPVSTLSEGVRALIGSPEEIAAFSAVPGGDRVLFAVKEATFKAVHPKDQVFLEFRDVTVDLTRQTATTHYGRVVHWRALWQPHILAIAWD